MASYTSKYVAFFTYKNRLVGLFDTYEDFTVWYEAALADPLFQWEEPSEKSSYAFPVVKGDE